MRTIFLVFTLCVVSTSSSVASEAFFEAARKGNLKKIEGLLDAGTDVNVKTEYGATALFFACDKGYLDIARLLIEKGATVNLSDTFYGATPYYWALSHDHFDILSLLISSGAPAEPSGFMKAVEKGHAGLIRAALAQGSLPPETLSAALVAAKSGSHDEIVKLLLDGGAKSTKESAPEVSQETLETYAGSYENAQIGLEISFRPETGKLKGVVSGQPEITYAPTDPTTFSSVEYPGITIVFKPTEGKVGSMTLKQGSSTFVFDRVERKAAPEVETVSAPPEEAMPVTSPSNWGSFRGNRGSGVADGQHPPLRWDVRTSHNIRWKTAIPGLGHSCPIVAGDRVFLTTAISGKSDPAFRHGQYGDVDSVVDESVHTWKLYCLQKDSGELLWEKEICKGVPKIRRHLKGSHASCTPATDGESLVVNLGAEGLYCYELSGNLRWKRDLGDLDSGWFYDPEYQWGFSSSPVLFEDLVIVQADIQKNSFISGYQLRDGKEVWKTRRDEIPSWGTPTIVESKDRVQVVTNSSKRVYGYDPRSGKELWRLGGNSEVTVGSPVFGHGLIFFTGGYQPIQPLYAVKVDAVGDITLKGRESRNDGVAWSHNRGGTYMPTPLVYGDHLYTLANSGVLTCYEATTGKRLYRNRVAGGKGGGYTASPVAADGKIYFTSEDGDIHVVKAGAKYELLASNSVGEVCMATPAISDGMIFVRSLGHLFCVGVKQ